MLCLLGMEHREHFGSNRVSCNPKMHRHLLRLCPHPSIRPRCGPGVKNGAGPCPTSLCSRLSVYPCPNSGDGQCIVSAPTSWSGTSASSYALERKGVLPTSQSTWPCTPACWPYESTAPVRLEASSSGVLGSLGSRFISTAGVLATAVVLSYSSGT